MASICFSSSDFLGRRLEFFLTPALLLNLIVLLATFFSILTFASFLPLFYLTLPITFCLLRPMIKQNVIGKVTKKRGKKEAKVSIEKNVASKTIKLSSKAGVKKNSRRRPKKSEEEKQMEAMEKK
jgi:hypothetical protein